MMRTVRTMVALLTPIGILISMGCAASKVDFSKIERPPRPAQLDAFNVFVGYWDWEAEMTNAKGADRNWSGTAEWTWTLDNRCLHGTMSAKTENASFDAAGIWSWNPKSKKYLWWMFNNWGYPQEGTASYDDETRCWRMNYTSIGLDGTTSHGRYRMTVVDNDTLDWQMEEWADPFHLIKKMEMTGSYKRK